MGNSLQDQLLRAGVANKKQAVRAQKAKNNKEKLQRSGKEVVDEATKLAKNADFAKREKDRELNRQKQAAADKKAIQAQILELINMNRIAARGDVEFSFDDNGRVRSIGLQTDQRKALISGRLALAAYKDGAELIPRVVANKIAERDASVLLFCNNAETDESADLDPDDDYANYKVPDDLMW